MTLLTELLVVDEEATLLELGVAPQLRTKSQASSQCMPVPGAYAQPAVDEHQPGTMQRYSLPAFCTN